MKPLVFVSCPIDTHSGYGARSRDIVKALIKSEKYDVKILPQRWGNTPVGFLKPENSDHKLMLDCIWPNPQLPKQPDVWIQITVPNEFQPVGKFNIGITAGIETTICAASWIDGLNRMDLNFVSSKHAKDVFLNSVFEERDNNTQQVIRSIKVEKPIEVLFEGVDINIFKKLDAFNGEVNDTLEDLIKEDFNFLFVGHWLQGEMGQDIKDVGMLIKTFLETFKDKKQKPGLILKVSCGNYSIMDRDEILDRIRRIEEHIGGDLPSIYLLHGELTDDEVNELYNHSKVKVSVSFTKGEGYGRPLLEASISGKPFIASNYSGHLDFLDSEMSILLPGEVKQIHPSAVVQNMILPESQWFYADNKQAEFYMKDVFTKYEKYLEKAKRQAHKSKTEFSLDKMRDTLAPYLEEVPKVEALKLPQLKKIELPTLQPVK